jgi:hypothetical protein
MKLVTINDKTYAKVPAFIPKGASYCCVCCDLHSKETARNCQLTMKDKIERNLQCGFRTTKGRSLFPKEQKRMAYVYKARDPLYEDLLKVKEADDGNQAADA